MNEQRQRWAREVARLRRIYEIKTECEEYTENLRNSDRVIDGPVPREVQRMLFTDWDRVLEHVWDRFNAGAYYEAVVLRRLFDDVTIQHEYHVCEGADGQVRHVDPDGSVHYGEETFGYDCHRYANVEHANDALYLLMELNEVLDKYEAPGYHHWAYVKNVTREDWA